MLGELEAFASALPFFFDADTLTDQPERVIVAEIVREKLRATCATRSRTAPPCRWNR